MIRLDLAMAGPVEQQSSPVPINRLKCKSFRFLLWDPLKHW